jgi:subtilisin family serine protease
MNAKVESFLAHYGGQYGLKSSADGASLLYGNRTLSPAVSQRVTLFLAQLPEGDVDAAAAAALRSFLEAKGAPDLESKLFTKTKDGERLTELGRNVLMDILTAEDGQEFHPSPALARKAKLPEFTTGVPRADVGLGAMFDGSAARRAAGYHVEGFDWTALDDPKKQTANLEGYSVNSAEKTVRVMVAAHASVSTDRLLVQSASEGQAALRESGLDEALLKAHGAQVVRAIGNLVVLDVPIDQAGRLGQELSQQGIDSRPARVIKMATQAIQQGPAWPDPFYTALPLPRRFASAEGAVARPETQEIQPLNLGSRNLMKIDAMHKAGMTGKGTVVGIIDSGLDLQHPDFKDRVAAYIDMTGDGLHDTVAHGTHVAGSVGGSGAASDGLYKGMAPDTKFVIIKVFGKQGSSSEDTILAGMAAARNLPAEIRPQVINMSLGGPGDPETDPLSVMANQMMLKDNILMAIAAGNSGPSKETIGTPGSARYVMTVTGVNHDGHYSFFPSRGPVSAGGGKGWNKPDISTVAGDVSMNQQRRAFWSRLMHPFSSSDKLGLFPTHVEPGAEPQDPGCFYGPGVISARSHEDSDTGCEVKGNPNYRFMSGTSMATPMAAGIAADAIGYLKDHDRSYQASEVKALMMETSDDLHQAPEVQGAGLVNGEKLAKALQNRVEHGLPVGNVAYMIGQRGASKWDEFNMKQDDRYKRTSLGLLDSKTGHLVNTDTDYDQALKQTNDHYKGMSIWSRAVRRVKYWFNG